MSSSSLATLRLVLRAASSRLAFMAGETRHVYTSLFRAMHYSVMQSGGLDQLTDGPTSPHWIPRFPRDGPPTHRGQFGMPCYALNLHDDSRILVLDVNLPNVDSPEACRDVMRPSPAMKVIMFSAFHDPNARHSFPEHPPSSRNSRRLICCRPSSACISIDADALGA